MKIKILQQCTNEDWKTALAHKQVAIPAGTIIDVYDVTQNCCGRYFDVIWDGSVRSIKMHDCQLVGPPDRKYIELIPYELLNNMVKA